MIESIWLLSQGNLYNHWKIMFLFILISELLFLVAQYGNMQKFVR